MATKKEQGAPELLTMEALQARYRTPPAVFAGVCAAQGWRAGKQLAEQEYTAAVAAFTGAPADGRAQGKTKKSGVKG